MAHQIYFLNLHEIWCFKLQRIKVSHIFADNFSLYQTTIHKCTTNQNNYTVIKCIYFINIQQSVDKKILYRKCNFHHLPIETRNCEFQNTLHLHTISHFTSLCVSRKGRKLIRYIEKHLNSQEFNNFTLLISVIIS